jgi:hypothetical protein
VRRALEVAGLVALAALVWLVGEAAWTVRQLRPHLEVTLENIDRVTIVAGVTASEVQKGALAWQKASATQSESATRVLGSSQATFASLQTLVKRTDASLNGSVLPSLAASLNEQNQALSANQARLGANLDELKTATVALQRTILDADSTFASPDVKSSLDAVSAATTDAAASMANLKGVTSDAKQAADYELKVLEAPVSKIKAALLFAVTVVGRFLGY